MCDFVNLTFTKLPSVAKQCIDGNYNGASAKMCLCLWDQLKFIYLIYLQTLLSVEFCREAF